jgi:hypothetical protein
MTTETSVTGDKNGLILNPTTKKWAFQGLTAGNVVVDAKPPYNSKTGTVIPDIVLGLVNGELFTNKTAVLIKRGDFSLIRFATSDNAVAEIRYHEQIFSANRLTALKREIQARADIASERAKHGNPRLIEPKRINRSKSHTWKETSLKRFRKVNPPTPLNELEAWYQKRSATKT